MAMTDALPAETALPRRRARLLSLLVTTLALLTAAWFVLRRRTPALPAFVAESQPGPSRTGRPTPAAPTVAPSEAAGPAASAVPAGEGVVDGPSDHITPPTAATTDRTAAASQELQRVSGIGRRTAEALVAAGIDSLDRLADSDDATLVAALEAAGLRRSPTLSAWASQARRLTRT